MEAWRKELYLAHHGIMGQRWGVRRGPPYPVGDRQKSTGKPAGRLDNRVEKSYAQVKRFSKAAKIGAIATLAGLAAYGAYRTGAFKHVQSLGEQAVKKTISRIGSAPVGSISGSPPPSDWDIPKPSASKQPKKEPIIRDPKTGFKVIHESLSDSLKNANPLKTSSDGDNILKNDKVCQVD